MARSPQDESTATALLLTAEEYAWAAERLLDTGPYGHIKQPFFHLICMALELSFKAVCKEGGATEGELNDLRHDLQRGLDAAIVCGLTEPLDPNNYVQPLVSDLQDFHHMHYFRYAPKRSHFFVPLPDAAVAILLRHVAECRRLVNVLADMNNRRRFKVAPSWS